MPTLNKIFDKCGVALYQNESLDLDHYYQEPYQDEEDEIEVTDCLHSFTPNLCRTYTDRLMIGMRLSSAPDQQEQLTHPIYVSKQTIVEGKQQ